MRDVTACAAATPAATDAVRTRATSDVAASEHARGEPAAASAAGLQLVLHVHRETEASAMVASATGRRQRVVPARAKRAERAATAAPSAVGRAARAPRARRAAPAAPPTQVAAIQEKT
jgi:hypothetical protein